MRRQVVTFTEVNLSLDLVDVEPSVLEGQMVFHALQLLLRDDPWVNSRYLIANVALVKYGYSGCVSLTLVAV